MLLLFVRLEVRGLENLKGIETNVIFAANHPSELDPFLIPASKPSISWPRYGRFAAWAAHR